MANLYKRWLCDESLKTLSSRPILIYFEFRSKPSLITVIWMDPHSPKKFIGTKYCLLILGDDTSFFFILSLFVSLFFVFMLCYLFCYYKFFQKLFSMYCSFYYLLWLLWLFFIYFFFFIKKYFNFFMFRDVPECSGMFRNVPCSGFYRRPSVSVQTCYEIVPC